MSAPFLPYGRQEISAADVEAVSEALGSDLITQGPRIREFEDALADYMGARHVVAFATGTAALHGAAFAAGIGPGDSALTTPVTFAASANCVLYQGGRPRFVDIDRATWNVDAEAMAGAAEASTKAFIPVSFAGLPVELGPLRRAEQRPLIIEDACHAIGGLRDGRPVGAPGGADLTVFSFHPVKLMTTGEGGAVATENDELAQRLRLFRTHGITREGIEVPEDAGGWWYDMPVLGFNYRITDFQCALGLRQLVRLDEWVERRNELADLYRELLRDDERVELPPQAGDGVRHAYHLFVVRVTEGARKRLEVFERLRAAGLGVQVHYIPVYRLSYYRETLGYPQDGCPEAERYYEGAISLPMFPRLERADVERVVRELQSALAPA